MAGSTHFPRRVFHVQNRRNPLRCQSITVAGLTLMELGCQSAQAADNQAKKTISGGQLRPLHRPLQNIELMTKGQNLKRKCRSLAKESRESRRQRHQRRRTMESKEERQPHFFSNFELCENDSSGGRGLTGWRGLLMQRLTGVLVLSSFALPGAAEPVPGLRERVEILGEQWGGAYLCQEYPDLDASAKPAPRKPASPAIRSAAPAIETAGRAKSRSSTIRKSSGPCGAIAR